MTLKHNYHPVEPFYRWAAKLFNSIVFVDHSHRAARLWCASTFEQLGFQE